MSKKDKLYFYLCEEAYPSASNEKMGGRQVNPIACAECESTCDWGIELLKTIDEKTFRSLLCGADCNKCRQPCNLWRIALMRNITCANSHKAKMHRSWLNIVMRPYYDREKRRREA